MRSRRRLHAFTLVELLVVIAIIAVLISLLIGPISRARRQALLLACPIAMQSSDYVPVIVHPRGSPELGIAPSYSGYERGPMWSTRGTWIGYEAQYFNDAVFIVRAATGKTYVHANWKPYDNIVGWADDDHFITADPVPPGANAQIDYVVREAVTGRMSEHFVVSNVSETSYGHTAEIVTRVPASSGAYYIAGLPVALVGGPTKIALLRRDFSIKKVIQSDPGRDCRPRVDPFGEYVAWTTIQNKKACVAVKLLTAPMNDSPEFLSAPGVYDGNGLFFTDWTEDGNILAFVGNIGPGARHQLVIMTRGGKFLRSVCEVKTSHYPGANWRKYMH